MADASNATIRSIIEAITNGILSPFITLLFVLATVIFLWGIISYIAGMSGDQKQIEQGKKIMFWGILGMFLMASAWGIVKVLCDFFETCAYVEFPGA